MQVQTDFSHPLKLNCSSIASSTPGNSNSFPEGELIKFEEFNNDSEQKPHLNFGHKKRLTIEINDSYDFNPSQMTPSESNLGIESATTEKESQNGNFFKKNDKNNEGPNYCIGQSQSPSFANSNSDMEINKILSYNAFLEQKIKELEKQNGQLKISLQSEKTQMKVLKTENESLKITIRKKDQTILSQKEKINKLSQKFQEQNAYFQEKIRQKDTQLQKVTALSKTSTKRASELEKKLMDVEKQAQKNFCLSQQETISRIKESSVRVKEVPVKSKELIPSRENKENLNLNNMGNTLCSTIQMRKSIDKKKCSQSQGKKSKPTKASQPVIKAQRASSSSNIAMKKLLIRKD